MTLGINYIFWKHETRVLRITSVDIVILRLIGSIKLQIDDIIVDLIDDRASKDSFILNNSKVDCNCLRKSLKSRSQGRWSKS